MSELPITLIEQALSGSENQLEFNFNIFDCYDLHEHWNFWDKITDEVQLTKNENRVSFRYDDRFKSSGIILRMTTIPSEIYHLFITGQVINGYQVFLRVRNRNPVLYLSPEITWKIGHEETRTACFRALSHHTDIIIFTDVNCSINLSPFVFTISSMHIIPDCLMSKGFISGPTGVVGTQGLQGAQGPSGGEIGGPQGVTGMTGSQGAIGNQGSVGDVGSQGDQGALGLVGEASMTLGFQGLQGAQGESGIIGPLGPMGPQGFQGLAGFMGIMGDMGFMGNVGMQGFMGFPGPMGPQGVTGPQAFIDGGNVNRGGEFISFSRGITPVVASVFIYYQITGDSVTVRIPPFITGPSTPAAALTALISAPLNTSVGKQVRYPVTISVDGVERTVAMDIGPGAINIYADISGLAGVFGALQTIETRNMTFTYLAI